MFFEIASKVAELSGYIHDLGKASEYFVSKLQKSLKSELGEYPSRDPLRHEWISTWLFKEMWSAQAWRFGELKMNWDRLQGVISKPPVCERIAGALDAVLWAVCTHHGAIGGNLENENSINDSRHVRNDPHQSDCLRIKWWKGLSDRKSWEELFCLINDVIKKIKENEAKLGEKANDHCFWEPILLVARAALILADHSVSSKPYDETSRKKGKRTWYANTKPIPNENSRGKKKRLLDQPLAYHLIKVGHEASAQVKIFDPQGLPHSKYWHQHLKNLKHPDFSWQDRASAGIESISGGKLVFNVASTGAGKTLANLKLGFAMRPEGVRLVSAFNLRTLTKQTIQAYAKHLKEKGEDIFDRDFCCLLGEGGKIEHDFLIEEDDDSHGECQYDYCERYIDMDEYSADLEKPDWFSHIVIGGLNEEKAAKLMLSPILVCTMDWITAAGEPGKQAKHAAAFLRVATSDLILDEVDSYDVDALVAVMRVIRTAASFGRNVIVSSATLSRTLAKGIADSYAAGWKCFKAIYGDLPWNAVIVGNLLDRLEFRVDPTGDDFDSFYRRTMEEACKNLKSVERRFYIADVSSSDCETQKKRLRFAEVIRDHALKLHDMNAFQPPGCQCRLSIGLIRMANISTCVKVSEVLREDGRFLIAVYHSCDILERRAYKEYWLDRILYRGNEDWVKHLACLLKLECQIDVFRDRRELRLIVIASPIEEVGRDHDFDWAIIEPSSMHSIIQCAGRVNRHRKIKVESDKFNIGLLSQNWKSLDPGERVVFTRPGFEVELGLDRTTHSSRSMFDIVNGRKGGSGYNDGVIHQAMIFDENGAKTFFAEYDERGIAKKLETAMPILKRSPGFESHFMFHDFPIVYPLRDKSGKEELTYYLDVREGKAYIDRGKPIGEPDGEVFYEPGYIANTWLVPDILKLQNEGNMLKLNYDDWKGNRIPRKITVLWNDVKLE